jgi:hypothetical protein
LVTEIRYELFKTILAIFLNDIIYYIGLIKIQEIYMSKRDLTEAFEDMDDDEILEKVRPTINIEFDMLDKKFVFRNVDDEFLKDFSILEFVKLFGIEIQWYYYGSFDRIVIRDKKFLIIEFTRKKIVLVRSNN